MTGLFNRLCFNFLFETYCQARAKDDVPFAMMFLDLDRFSVVNQTYGDEVGDAILGEVARRLEGAVAEADVVARLGGDEFAVLQGDLKGMRQVFTLAENIVAVMRQPFLVKGHTIELSMSLGVSVAPEDGSTPEALKRSADLALDRAKQEGKCTYRLFEREMDTKTTVRRHLEQSLRHAGERGEIEVHFQPQVEAGSGRPVGAEALLRWRHPELGMISPAEFIPLAEETGLIGALGEMVLRTACEVAVGWPEHLTLAVNVSPLQFRDRGLVRTIAQILAETGFPACRLELEITEGVVLNDSGVLRSILDELRGLGVRIALDDFGTGYSSLTYLSRYPFHKLKIDRSFVARLGEDDTHSAIVRTVIALGRALGMSTVGEGVETPQQERLLVQEGCDEVQGFLYGKPMSASAASALFRTCGAALPHLNS